MDVFIPTNRTCRGRIEFFLEWPYLGRATILLNVLLSHASHPSASNVLWVMTFLSVLPYAGVEEKQPTAETQPWSSRSLPLPFHSTSSVPSLLAQNSSLPKWTLLSLAVPWAALFVCSVLHSVPVLCRPTAIVPWLPAQYCAARVVFISLLAAFPSISQVLISKH